MTRSTDRERFFESRGGGARNGGETLSSHLAEFPRKLGPLSLLLREMAEERSDLVWRRKERERDNVARSLLYVLTRNVEQHVRKWFSSLCGYFETKFARFLPRSRLVDPNFPIVSSLRDFYPRSLPPRRERWRIQLCQV